jgi:LysM repeat protein
MAEARRPHVGQVETVGTVIGGGIGIIEPGTPGFSQPKPNPRSQPNRPGAIFKRSDTPFSGDGTHVTISKRDGVTKRGYLDVPFRFQIPPLESWQRSFTGRWSNFDVVGGADGPVERTRFGGPGLRTVNFRTMFLDWHPTWGVWQPDLLEPILAVRELEQLTRKGVIFALKVRNEGRFTHDDVNMLATITQGDVEEVSGEPDTRYVTISFQEYDELEAGRQARGASGTGGVTIRSNGASHTIKAGDTLYSLARTYYRRQSDWRTIALANAGMGNWAPTRALTEWSKQTGRKRVKVPGMLASP